MASGNLPLPAHYNRGEAEQVWKIKYEDLAHEAEEWAKSEKMIAAISDRPQICLLLVDCQNTFCTPGFELFVAGRSGNAAVEDSIRITEFIYRNLSAISNISLSMDTHYPIQIFHSIFLIDKEGNHPDPMTAISKKDIEQGKWRVDPKIAGKLSGCDYNDLQAYLRHYCGQLEQSGKYRLMVWPYHSMLGGIGHALVSLIEEAVFFTP